MDSRGKQKNASDYHSRGYNSRRNNSNQEDEDRYYDSKKTRKPNQVFYVPNDSKDFRNVPRSHSSNSSTSTSFRTRDVRQNSSEPQFNSLEFPARDSRSMEQENRNRTTRRSSQNDSINPTLRCLPANIASLPPRFRKKYLAESGLNPLDYVIDSAENRPAQSNWSNTLPSSRRPQRYEESEQHKKYNQHSYINKTLYRSSPNNQHGNVTHRNPDRSDQERTVKVKNEDKILLPNNVPAPIRADFVFDWNDDVEKSETLMAATSSSNKPKDTYTNNKTRRRRNRSTSSTSSVDQIYGYAHEHKPSQASRLINAQQGNVHLPYSRETSLERQAMDPIDRNHRRNRGRFRPRSRENSQAREETNIENRWHRNNTQNWRSVADNMSMSELSKMTQKFENDVSLHSSSVDDESQSLQPSRTLFDPNNPSKLIILPQSTKTRLKNDADKDTNGFEKYMDQSSCTKMKVCPIWFNPDSEQFKRHSKKDSIRKLETYDNTLQLLIDNGELFEEWTQVMEIRGYIQKIFQDFLITEMKFCHQENVEHYFWKLLYYNLIELLRKQMNEVDQSESNQRFLKLKLLNIIDSGIKYLESLLGCLESQFKFSLEDYTGQNAGSHTSGLKYIGLALVSAQKIFLFLGDLARYRELINQTNNFGKAKQFYVKAQQIFPKNGRPHNQLGVISVISKRKIDAVYHYMRSLMSANPFLSARESLNALFDEIRKKYESSQRRRDEKNRLRLKDKEIHFDENLRREIWIHPEGGPKSHDTCAPVHANIESSEEEELEALGPSDLNKRFITSFLHIQGKLITKIGMETFQTSSIQMLREFRALLQHSPLAITSHRLIQIWSLNMYTISCTQIKDPSDASFERSDNAVSISLLMFGIVLERFIFVLNESTFVEIEENKSAKKSLLILTEDGKVMLPAIKVWCDWMLAHAKVWNPPPELSYYKFGTTNTHDPWNGLSILMTMLEKIDTNRDILNLKQEKDCVLVRLQEDITLSGFTPLNYNSPEPIFCQADIDIEVAQNALRLQKLIFFGTFLCDEEPPVLKKTISGTIKFSNIVENKTKTVDTDILLENELEDSKSVTKKESECVKDIIEGTEIHKLLLRKDELERKQKVREKHSERLQEILNQSTVALHIEVRPKFLIPDTNCFVDYLEEIKSIAKVYPVYQLMIPIVVINELEGLSRGSKPIEVNGISTQPMQGNAKSANDHAAMVATMSKNALEFINSKNQALKCVTTKGSILMSSIFTSEDDCEEQHKSNDDKILRTALNLCKNSVDMMQGEVRFMVREVVLLTTDRNLRVKALSNDLPVRELPDFVKWAGLIE